jgi:hypothetical protein
MSEIKQRPDQTDEEFWAEVDPFDDRLSDELPLWSCFVILAVLLAFVATGVWLVL